MFNKINDKFSIRKTKIAVGSIVIASMFSIIGGLTPLSSTVFAETPAMTNQ